MAIWRMAFRDYTDGPSFWPDCRQRGIATITYHPVADIDFSQHPTDQATPGWADLAPGAAGCLRHFVHDLAGGDVIYVKEGPLIVGRGIVSGPYHFNPTDPIVVQGGVCPYRHERRVRWCPEFQPVQILVGQPQITALLQLAPADGEMIEAAVDGAQ
jgi:hypothetical protein